LLWQLVEVIPEHCMLRVGMTNPPYILEHLEEVAKVLQHPRVYSFLHVPVQVRIHLQVYSFNCLIKDFCYRVAATPCWAR